MSKCNSEISNKECCFSIKFVNRLLEPCEDLIYRFVITLLLDLRELVGKNQFHPVATVWNSTMVAQKYTRLSAC